LVIFSKKFDSRQPFSVSGHFVSCSTNFNIAIVFKTVLGTKDDRLANS